MEPLLPTQLSAILSEMATLTTMERGTLTEEYRTSSPATGSVQLGPYFKFQVWEDGRNVSCRIPADQAADLKKDLAHHQRFTELADAFVKQTIAKTRVLRRSAPDLDDAPSASAKKNSAKKPRGSSITKPTLSSKKPGRA